MAHYVVGDIHGCFDEWMALKDKIEAKDKNAKFILLGDIIDRGPKSYEMLQWAMKNTKTKTRYQMVIGNHEYEKLSYLRAYFHHKAVSDEFDRESKSFADWEADYYDFKQMCLDHKLKDVDLKRIIQFFSELPFVKEVDKQVNGKKVHFIIVHAYVPQDCYAQDGTFDFDKIDIRPLKVVDNFQAERRRDAIVWNRNLNNPPEGTYVIHGHSPVLGSHYGDGSGKVCISGRDVNVDCGMVFAGQMPEANLVAYCLDTMEPVYLREIEDAPK